MSVNGFSTLHDPEVQAYNAMRAAYKAREKEQKRQAKQARRELIESLSAKHGSSSGSFNIPLPGGVGAVQIARLQERVLRREADRKEEQRVRRAEMGYGAVVGEFYSVVQLFRVVLLGLGMGGSVLWSLLVLTCALRGVDERGLFGRVFRSKASVGHRVLPLHGKAEPVVERGDVEWDGETDVEDDDDLRGDGKLRAKTSVVKS
jgi:hypothetical protein